MVGLYYMGLFLQLPMGKALGAYNAVLSPIKCKYCHRCGGIFLLS